MNIINFQFNNRPFKAMMLYGELVTPRNILKEEIHEALMTFIKKEVLRGDIIPEGYMYQGFEVTTIIDLDESTVYTLEFNDWHRMLKFNVQEDYIITPMRTILESIPKASRKPICLIERDIKNGIYFNSDICHNVVVQVVVYCRENDENGNKALRGKELENHIDLLFTRIAEDEDENIIECTAFMVVDDNDDINTITQPYHLNDRFYRVSNWRKINLFDLNKVENIKEKYEEILSGYIVR